MSCELKNILWSGKNLRGEQTMMLDTLLDYLADMAVLYGRAVVYVDIDGVKHRVTFLEGESGHPNIVMIKAKRIKDDFN